MKAFYWHCYAVYIFLSRFFQEKWKQKKQKKSQISWDVWDFLRILRFMRQFKGRLRVAAPDFFRPNPIVLTQAVKKKRNSMSASFRRPIAVWNRKSRKERFAATYTIDWIFLNYPSHPSAADRKISVTVLTCFWSVLTVAITIEPANYRRRPWNPCRNMLGPAT